MSPQSSLAGPPEANSNIPQVVHELPERLETTEKKTRPEKRELFVEGLP